MAEPRNNMGNNRKLPKDQEKLNEAVRAKTAEETNFSASDKATIAGYSPLLAAEAVGDISKKLKTPRDISAAIRTPMVSSPNVVSGVSKVATSPLMGAGRLASLTSPLAIYTGVDIATSMIRDDGKGLSQVTGEVLGGAASNALYGDDLVSKDASQPMPTEYAELAKQGFNPQKPIIGRGGVIRGYEKLPVDPTPDAPVSTPQMDRLGDQALDFNQPVVGQGTTAPRQAPLPQVKDTSTAFEGSYLLPSGETMGLVKGGGTRVMTPQEIQQYEMSIKDAPLISGERTAEAPISADGVFMSPSAAKQFIPDDPRVKPLGELTRDELVKRASDLQTAAKEAGATPTEAQRQSEDLVSQYYKEKESQAPTKAPEMSRGERAVANFGRFKESGEEMTPDMVAQAELFAESMGLGFDQEKGYTNKFDPAILAEYKRKVEAGEVPRPQETTEQKFTRESREAREATEARRAAPPAFPERDGRVAEEEARGTISVGGQQVPNTEANRTLRDQEKSLKEAGKREGLRGAELRTYIRDGMKERADITREEVEAQEDREVKKVMDDLNISNAQARLEYNIQRLLPDPPERPSPSVISDFVKTAEDDFDLVFDPETFTFSTVEGRLLISDKEHPLNPNSQIYKTMSQLEGAEYLLAPPPDVLENLDEYVQLAEKGRKGKSFVKSNDGRVYEVNKNGNVTHTGYSSK